MSISIRHISSIVAYLTPIAIGIKGVFGNIGSLAFVLLKYIKKITEKSYIFLDVKHKNLQYSDEKVGRKPTNEENLVFG